MIFGKKTEAMFAQAAAIDRLADEQYAENKLKRDELQQQQSQFEEQQRTKDRADVSLDDYLKLLAEMEELKHRNDYLEKTLQKAIIKPVLAQSRDQLENKEEEIIHKILRGEFEPEVSVFKGGFYDPLELKIAFVYKFKMRDLR